MAHFYTFHTSFACLLSTALGPADILTVFQMDGLNWLCDSLVDMPIRWAWYASPISNYHFLLMFNFTRVYPRAIAHFYARETWTYAQTVPGSFVSDFRGLSMLTSSSCLVRFTCEAVIKVQNWTCKYGYSSLSPVWTGEDMLSMSSRHRHDIIVSIYNPAGTLLLFDQCAIIISMHARLDGIDTSSFTAARTSTCQPLASGDVSMFGAFVFLISQLALGVWLLMQLPNGYGHVGFLDYLRLGLSSLGLVVLYPAMNICLVLIHNREPIDGMDDE
ncbi:uncharacterized protein HD556DRAFT_1313029 [Suillus plorans]|uniref:Uncharacterized protein n=1 Tax=Suillus plorans TaxID=116603 RepID=A0A9P7DBB8_9AGAM|nr:uncharacterized protein HD556DRAFT_1313029 [Suillus plorans]KAG1787084.1 hypothetical protein HD556DRAFT_1313029 [Suillus plorans]